MKTKLFFTFIVSGFFQISFSQEIKPEGATNQVTDSIVNREKTIKDMENETNGVLPVAATATASAAEIIAAQKAAEKAEKKAQKEAEKVLKERERAQKEVEDAKKEVERNRERLEKQQDKFEKEQQAQQKQKDKINDAEDDLAKAKDRLKDAEKDLVSDTEKHNKKLAKGKLSPNDIEKFEKDKVKQQRRIEELKEKVEKEEHQLRKAKR